MRSVGHDPDYRFSLANERTFLAWIRTALALLAGGVAVVQLVPAFKFPGGRLTLGVILVVLSLVVGTASYSGGWQTRGQCAWTVPWSTRWFRGCWPGD